MLARSLSLWLATVYLTAVAADYEDTETQAIEIDLLGALSLHNTSRDGVTAAPGMQPQRTAYTLRGETRSLQVKGAAFERAVELLRGSPEFTVLATLKQELGESGTILSFSDGNNTYLTIQSSGLWDEVQLNYVVAGTTLTITETFPFRLADGAWHRLALSVSGVQATLLVDCIPLYRLLITPPDCNFTQPLLALWVGQTNRNQSLFKGSFQELRLVSGPHGYLAQCPGHYTLCPTCELFDLLQPHVQELTTQIHDLLLKLAATETRLARLEQCDCQKSCYSNGMVHADGEIWQEDCNRCSCVHGEVKCRIFYQYDCMKRKYSTCSKKCILKWNLYEHGDRVTPKEYTECVCNGGNMQCTRVDPEVVCPKLECDAAYQFAVPGESCKFCPGVDYCSMGHSCAGNAKCINLSTKYACQCNQGFQLDGPSCQDVDECQRAGGLDGHSCQSNTRCVNLVGGYVCLCLPGYTRTDKFNCQKTNNYDIDIPRWRGGSESEGHT